MTFLLQVLASEVAPPAVNFTGSGTLEVPEVAYLTGSGALTADHTYTFMDGGSRNLSGEGTLTVDEDETGQQYVQEHVLVILDSDLDQAPTSVVVVMQNADPETQVDFYIDTVGAGLVVYTATTDSEGDLGPTSIPVSIANGAAGLHTVYAVSSGLTSSATFTLTRAANTNPTDPAADTDPVQVPEAVTSTDVYRWVLQDLAPGGLGSYVFPANPDHSDPWPFRRTVGARHTTAHGGRFHLFEPAQEPYPFSFAGVALSSTFVDALRDYAELNRRLYLIDHRNRAWTIAITGTDFTPRLRSNLGGTLSDWVHDYTVRCVIFGDQWQVPA